MRARPLAVFGSLLALAAGSRDLSAQQAARRKPFTLGLALNAVSIDRATADAQAVHDRSVGLQFDVGYAAMRYFVLGADFGFAGLSDHAAFTQSTTGGDKRSTAALITFSGVAGPRTPALRLAGGLPTVSLGLLAGATKTIGERSITDCLDCRSDRIEIPGGAFVQPTVVLGSGKTRVRLSDRHFVKGDGVRYVVSAGVELGGR